MNPLISIVILNISCRGGGEEWVNEWVELWTLGNLTMPVKTELTRVSGKLYSLQLCPGPSLDCMHTTATPTFTGSPSHSFHVPSLLASWLLSFHFMNVSPNYLFCSCNLGVILSVKPPRSRIWVYQLIDFPRTTTGGLYWYPMEVTEPFSHWA